MLSPTNSPLTTWLLMPLFTLVLAGCAGQGSIPSENTKDAIQTPEKPHQPTDTPTTETQENAAATEKPEKGSFQPSTLYSLLVAEIAGQRGLSRVTLYNYVQEAEKTQDLGIIKRATQLAGQLRNNNALIRTSTLWSQLEPQNPIPYRILTQQFIQLGNVEKAQAMLSRALELNSINVVDLLANRAHKMPEHERRAYIQVLNQLLTTEPENPHLLYAKASLLVYQDKFEQALKLTQQALDSDPDFDRAILLEADLQSRTGHLDTAISHLRERLEDRDHKQMRTLYTRFLLEKKQYALADQQAQILAKTYPDDHNLRFYLGVLMFDHGQIDASDGYFTDLYEIVGNNSALNYYQGRIAETRDQNQQALEYYLKVTDSTYLLASYSQISKLLGKKSDRQQLSSVYLNARQNHPQNSPSLYSLESTWLIEHNFNAQAMSLLNTALIEHPEDKHLRYTRAMLSESMGGLALLERDLRYLLKSDPNNATTLNALGYSLTEHTDRHEEALGYIEKALKIKPDDPAILDSMGWVHYNLGNFRMALEFLLQAYQSFPDPEIAAHLGAAYWTLGETEQANKIWNDALADHPGNAMIKNAQRISEQQGNLR